MGLGFMGSFGFGMGWKSWSFQGIGLFLSAHVLFIRPRNNISAPGPMFAIMEQEIPSAHDAVSLPLCLHLLSSSIVKGQPVSSGR